MPDDIQRPRQSVGMRDRQREIEVEREAAFACCAGRMEDWNLPEMAEAANSLRAKQGMPRGGELLMFFLIEGNTSSAMARLDGSVDMGRAAYLLREDLLPLPTAESVESAERAI